MVMHAMYSNLRFGQIASYIAKLFWTLRKLALPSFPFFDRQRVIESVIDFFTSQLGCLRCAFVAAPSRLLCRRDKRLIDEAADCL
jgi:hypothetical protein